MAPVQICLCSEVDFNMLIISLTGHHPPKSTPGPPRALQVPKEHSYEYQCMADILHPKLHTEVASNMLIKSSNGRNPLKSTLGPPRAPKSRKGTVTESM